ncbi:hypothetical protein [Dyadobacter sp.]|uniref:hypothetical protein n=1 Tax=Dyadobacter sp. TaxID=1914288 RepID=UPI003F70F419
MEERDGGGKGKWRKEERVDRKKEERDDGGKAGWKNVNSSSFLPFLPFLLSSFPPFLKIIAFA